MVRTTGIPTHCESCGYTSGHADARCYGTRIRCDECGQFAERDDDYCLEHDVHPDHLPAGYNSCPYCDERRRVEAEEQEMMARRADPSMHPTVDAPRF